MVVRQARKAEIKRISERRYQVYPNNIQNKGIKLDKYIKKVYIWGMKGGKQDGPLY